MAGCISALPDQPSSPPKAPDLVARSATQPQAATSGAGPGKEDRGEGEAASPESRCPSDEGTFDMLGTSSSRRTSDTRFMQRGRGDSSLSTHGTGASCRKRLWHSQSEAADKGLPREGLRLSWAEHTQVRFVCVTQHGALFHMTRVCIFKIAGQPHYSRCWPDPLTGPCPQISSSTRPLFKSEGEGFSF